LKEDEMAEACSMHGTGDTCVQSFAKEKLKKRDHLEYLGIDGDNIKIDLRGICGRLWNRIISLMRATGGWLL
jgi:hypothetical protein